MKSLPMSIEELDDQSDLFLTMKTLMELWEECIDQAGWIILNAALVHVASRWIDLQARNGSSVQWWENR